MNYSHWDVPRNRTFESLYLNCDGLLEQNNSKPSRMAISRAVRGACFSDFHEHHNVVNLWVMVGREFLVLSHHSQKAQVRMNTEVKKEKSWLFQVFEHIQLYKRWLWLRGSSQVRRSVVRSLASPSLKGQTRRSVFGQELQYWFWWYPWSLVVTAALF